MGRGFPANFLRKLRGKRVAVGDAAAVVVGGVGVDVDFPADAAAVRAAGSDTRKVWIEVGNQLFQKGVPPRRKF